MADVCVDLKLDRSKINSNFEQYKLSLDSIPCYKKTTDSKPDCIQLSSHQFSFQHVKSFGNQNLLFGDPWIIDSVYFISEKWKIMKFSAKKNTEMEDAKSVLQLEQAAELRSKSERVSPTLTFPNEAYAFIGTGTGSLVVAKTFDRNEELMWKAVHTTDVVDSPFIVLHSVAYTQDKVQKLDCLLLHVDSVDEKEHKKNLFQSVLEWLSFVIVENKDDVTLQLDRTRRLQGTAPPDYACIEPDGKGVVIGSENKYSMSYDSLIPIDMEKIEMPEAEADIPTGNDPASVYTWNQTSEDVNIYFPVPSTYTKSDIKFKLTRSHIDVSLSDGEVELLKGKLFDEVDAESSTWQIANSEVKSAVGDFVTPDQLRLHIILSKKVENSDWPIVVEDDNRGTMLSTGCDINEAFEFIQKTINPDHKPAFNAQQLEECDAFPDEHSVLLRIDGEEHKISHQVNLGSHQWLFNCVNAGSSSHGICLRHDVDGILWQLNTDHIKPKMCPWQHVATFNAFGYVQASKQQRRFTTCSTDYSYAVIADSVRHLYIYWQPTKTSSPVRNRKTGETISEIARQQLVSLETVENITGIHATPNNLFVMAGNIMHLLKVKQDEIA